MEGKKVLSKNILFSVETPIVRNFSEEQNIIKKRRIYELQKGVSEAGAGDSGGGRGCVVHLGVGGSVFSSVWRNSRQRTGGPIAPGHRDDGPLIQRGCFRAGRSPLPLGVLGRRADSPAGRAAGRAKAAQLAAMIS